MRCLGIIFVIPLLIPSLSSGQIKITADTLSNNSCGYVARIKTGKIIIDSQEQYEQAEFINNHNGKCVPFDEIDFNKSMLVGFQYRGSNCDSGIKWSTIMETDTGYRIQFATTPNHVCRDLTYLIAWFIVDKPQGKVDIAFERVFKEENSR
jgi:hypothetical protein